jgi:hypothetical protein
MPCTWTGIPLRSTPAGDSHVGIQNEAANVIVGCGLAALGEGDGVSA